MRVRLSFLRAELTLDFAAVLALLDVPSVDRACVELSF